MKDGKEDGKIKEEDCGAGHVVCKSVCKEGEGVSLIPQPTKLRYNNSFVSCDPM